MKTFHKFSGKRILAGLCNIRSCCGRLMTDDRGGEVIEYALIAGLITVTVIVVATQVGTKVLARWNSVNSSM